jgi:hypothetical protein
MQPGGADGLVQMVQTVQPAGVVWISLPAFPDWPCNALSCTKHCALHTVHCTLCNVHIAHCTQYTVHTAPCTVHTAPCTVHTAHCTNGTLYSGWRPRTIHPGEHKILRAPSAQCVVCSVQCALCSVQCAVCSVLCAVCSVRGERRRECANEAIVRPLVGSVGRASEVWREGPDLVGVRTSIV